MSRGRIPWGTQRRYGCRGGSLGDSALIQRKHESDATGRYSMTTRSLGPRPKVSGSYISSALAGGTTKVPGVVARAT